jgi:hypothetical protein
MHVEGMLKISGKTAPGRPASSICERLGDTSQTIPCWSGEVTTDAAGHFKFERVKPGEISLARDIRIQTAPS